MHIQAILLGHVVRRQLLHQVREEYERTVQEIRTGSSLPLANQVIHCPKKNALCYPVFKDRVEEMSEHHAHSYHGREGTKSSAVSDAASPGMHESSNILNLETSVACGDVAEIQPTITVSGHGLDIGAATQRESASDVHSESPLSSEKTSLSTLLDSQGAGSLVYNTDQSQTSTLPSSTASVNEQFEKQPPLVQNQSPPLLTSVPVPATVAVSDSQPHWKSAVSQLEGDTVDEHCLELSGPAFSDLPQDRKSLMELRAQLSVELLWIKQAIASRQNVSDFKAIVCHVLNLSSTLTPF